MHLRPDFSRFGHDLLLEKILPNAGQNCFRTVTFPPPPCFSFSMFLWHYFIYDPLGFGKALLALILGGTSKSRVYEKIFT